MVGFVLVLALTAARERTVAGLLTASELLYRRSFENSLSGMLITHRNDERWTVQTVNPAAIQLLPQVRAGESDVAELLGPAAVSALNQASASDAEGPTELELADGRHLTASITPLGSKTAADSYSIQLIDITDTLIAQRLMEADLTRAQQVQRGLSPRTLPIRRGWEHGAASLTAREVGGDFYDLRISGSNATMALGDVMGKGMGAGILAAATRTALRASNVAAHPAEALADSARVIEDDLANADAFVTLSCASIDLVTGRVRLVDAGHGLSFALRQDHSVERLATFDFPLGLGNDWRELPSHLDPGEGLLMVSDGVLELWGSSIEELIEAIGAADRACAGQSPTALVDTLCAGRPDSPERSDDATAVLLRREKSTR
ncbi:SpoIIE family protein phosphatase [Propionicimonas sp.]|uniref:PP2C family protein-serine/threonine phosphatase n=1 Tax=Propionicimonas sp. TaxID=1955623 RepID=UPI0017D3E963|nr:SpoIIE family protein phosphatase [Propionicimonas sp.]MBU3978021.1 SpoIIE family protein phosphatase [Actinomycetota bacterium]MBA3021757.1 SpoIIE family protein phosphatase [Propionicimonas sp.]MBU3985465.1 SpoIIE family protein phosphatase [Actinomycetota bacterium]MBU4007560.1 SpoIIE family protein phosphatase [Actinomycetota bacterium]MBU4066546.1 SpoIIE family protein phosphatase [Actinomycetota bacterium]